MNPISLERTGQGAPLIFIHGWGWNKSIWYPLIPYLEKDFELFLLDLPGFGESPVLSNAYTFEALFDAIIPFLPQNATWIGWSLGGMLSWWGAIFRSRFISRLITVASSPQFVQTTNWPGVPLPTLQKFADTLTTQHQKTLSDFLNLQLLYAPETVTNALKEIMLHSSSPNINALQGGLTLLEKTELKNDLHKVTCPSLHIFGQLDPFIPVRVIPLIENLINPMYSKCHLIKKTGHIPFLTHPDYFTTFIKDWMNAHPVK